MTVFNLFLSNFPLLKMDTPQDQLHKQVLLGVLQLKCFIQKLVLYI